MVRRDPEDKRRRLLESGLAEFSERGLAGARLERIARGAGVSAGLLYSHFASKEALFDAIFAAIIDQVITMVPIDAADLPGYAVRLRRAAREHPREARFGVWHDLERGDVRLPELAAAEATKLDAIRHAQRDGVVTRSLSAEAVLAAVVAIAHDYRGPVEGEDDAIRELVARVVAPVE